MLKRTTIEQSFRSALIILSLSELAAAIGPVIDGIIIAAYYGADGVQQFGLVNPLIIAYSVLGSVFAVGSVTLCTRLVGKGKTKEARGAFSVAFLWVLILSVIITIALLCLADPMTRLLGADPSSGVFYTETRNYYIGLTVSFPATNLLLLLNAYMQVDNDTRRTLFSTIVLTAADVVGDLLNAILIRGGMLGMGVATSIANYLALVVVLLHFTKKDVFFKPRFTALPWKLTGQMIASGFTAFVMLIGNTAAFILLNRILVNLGNAAALVAFTAMRSVFGIITTVVKGLGRSVMSMAGLFYGERNKEELSNLFRMMVKYTILLAGGVAILTLVLARPLASVFIGSSGQQILPEAEAAVRWLAPCLPFMAFNVGYDSFFRGDGRVWPSLWLTLLRDFLLPVLAGFALSGIFQAQGVYGALAAAQILLFAGIIVVWMVHIRKGKTSGTISRILFLPSDFEIPDEKSLAGSISNMDECMDMSQRIQELCNRQGMAGRKAVFASLCVEEMGKNILEHGFEKKSNQISLFAYEGEDQLLHISIRDNCKPFSPVEWEQIHHNDQDQLSNLGIRMAGKLSKEMRYVNLMDMNSLYLEI